MVDQANRDVPEEGQGQGQRGIKFVQFNEAAGVEKEVEGGGGVQWLL